MTYFIDPLWEYMWGEKKRHVDVSVKVHCICTSVKVIEGGSVNESVQGTQQHRHLLLETLSLGKDTGELRTAAFLCAP